MVSRDDRETQETGQVPGFGVLGLVSLLCVESEI